MSSAAAHVSNDTEKIAQTVPQSWRCGDDFQYSLPEPEEDPWNMLLKSMLERDTVQCDAWVDEVQNLLLFAGLFSAVVTAFAVETYKDLQEDPVVALLAQIAANSANNGSAPTKPHFTPGASTIRLNVFLFLSLILSLSTVLVGIVALQWIREHRQNNNAFTPQNMFAMMHMRTEALHKWRVPQIFAALPLLLQFALVFFFAGIVQLLVDASTVVLIPVACVMGMTITFLISTTILPTAQVATLTHLHDDIPAPCPYKSPQANAFRRLITSSTTLFKATSLSFAAAHWVIIHILLLPRQVFALTCCRKAIKPLFGFIGTASGYVLKLFRALSDQASPLFNLLRNANREEWHGFDYMKPHILTNWQLRSWFEFDLGWMSVRDNYFQSICPPESWLFQHREARQQYAALYDATQGLCKELTKNNLNRHINEEPALVTAYHCAMKLCAPSAGHLEERDTLVEAYLMRNQYLAMLLGGGEVTPLRPFSDNLRHTDIVMLSEEAAFIILSFIQDYLNCINERSPLLTNHYAEICFRLVNELYSKPYKMNNDMHVGQLTDIALDGEYLYALKIYDAPSQPFTHQWASSIKSFFSVLDDPSIPQPTILTSFHAHPFFYGYSANFWLQVRYEIHTQAIQESTINEIINTLSIINNMLAECFTDIDKTDANNGLKMIIFQSSAVHLWNYAKSDITPSILSEATDATMECLREAHKRLFISPTNEAALRPKLRPSVNRAWPREDWWIGLFPGAISEHMTSATTPPAYPHSTLTIEIVV